MAGTCVMTWWRSLVSDCMHHYLVVHLRSTMITSKTLCIMLIVRYITYYITLCKVFVQHLQHHSFTKGCLNCTRFLLRISTEDIAFEFTVSPNSTGLLLPTPHPPRVLAQTRHISQRQHCAGRRGDTLVTAASNLLILIKLFKEGT